MNGEKLEKRAASSPHNKVVETDRNLRLKKYNKTFQSQIDRYTNSELWNYGAEISLTSQEPFEWSTMSLFTIAIF